MVAKPRKTAIQIAFHLCPRCYRAIPAQSGERFCTNCGEGLLTKCPGCESAITSPETRFCAKCGLEFTSPKKP